jgi:neutral amino acid transport system permease protein
MFNYNYIVFLTISTGIFALFSLGLNVQWGYAGLINFGHVAFMTIGAYATVLLASGGIPLVIAVIVGGLLAATLGLIIGLSTLRLREDYLAIVTIGVSEVIRLVALNEEWLTQGAFGIQRYPLPLGDFQPSLFSKIIMIALLSVVMGLAGWQLWRRVRQKLRQQSRKGTKSRQGIGSVVWAVVVALFGLWVYLNGALALYNYSYKAGLMLVTLITLAVVYWGLEFLISSPWGRVLKAIREDEEIPKALGKNVFWYKLQAFMLGGIIAGIAGAFFAWQLTTVYPSNFEPLITFYAWTIIVLGGAGNNAGTILGAVIFWAYFEGTRFLIPDNLAGGGNEGAIRIMIIGLILMVLMLWRPQGILGKEEELTLGR